MIDYSPAGSSPRGFVMAVESLNHSHSDSWRETMDWVDLRAHVIAVHHQNAAEIDQLDGELDGTGRRRKRAEAVHHALHLDARPTSEVA
jgi:hypothetical protein